MSSSPEPELVRVARSDTRSAQVVRRKKRKPARNAQPLAVIEISDTDSDEDKEQAGPSTAVQGPSKPLRKRNSKSLLNKNINQSPKRAAAAPLFLSSDDEENEAPKQDNNMPDDGTLEPMALDYQARFYPIQISSSSSRELDPEIEHGLDVPKDLEEEQDPATIYLAQVLEIVPDVQPEHAANLVEQHLRQQQQQNNNVVELILHTLFENPNYPKVDKKGKRKATLSNEQNKDTKKARVSDVIDYATANRAFNGGEHYTTLAIDQLMLDFPEIPKPHIRRTLFSLKTLYAPTYFHLSAEKKSGGHLPYIPKKSLHRRPPKGKGPALVDAEFEREREWLVQRLAQDEQGMIPEQSNQNEQPENVDEVDDGIECGCCFTGYAFDKMIQCEDGHLFCTECMTSYAEGLLGSHNVNIICMDQSGCKLPFPVSELRRFLSDKLMDLYERVKQRKEIEMAGIEGLEECPFCDYKCVIENQDEKLFRCGNEDSCGAITCRQCKKPDHLPKSCKEMEEDRVLDGRHAIEEAMTRALMRKCPKCSKAFVKEDGCNKMMCPNCHSLVCYVCRKLIPEGYAHFNQNAPGLPTVGSSSQSKKCPLWERVEERHAKEVEEAAEKAKAEWQHDNPDVDEKDIHVDVPKAPPAPAMLGGRMPGMPNLAHLYGGMDGNLGGMGFGGMALPPLPHPIPPDYLRVRLEQLQRDRAAARAQVEGQRAIVAPNNHLGEAPMQAMPEMRPLIRPQLPQPRNAMLMPRLAQIPQPARNRNRVQLAQPVQDAPAPGRPRVRRHR
ncbi:hypothetical protein VNI00_008243 [Paramarasmius palmivorus]|uniref:RING-type domain-containing protein n=1 Tax=Paramarasmius palmivorus TaxID=297713 RepID=A0AAW0CYL0_9AGAR